MPVWAIAAGIVASAFAAVAAAAVAARQVYKVTPIEALVPAAPPTADVVPAWSPHCRGADLLVLGGGSVLHCDVRPGLMADSAIALMLRAHRFRVRHRSRAHPGVLGRGGLLRFCRYGCRVSHLAGAAASMGDDDDSDDCGGGTLAINGGSTNAIDLALTPSLQ